MCYILGDGDDDDGVQDLEHTTLLESFLFMIVKLRFPESLSTLLIGLLPINDFKVSRNLPTSLASNASFVTPHSHIPEAVYRCLC